MTDAIRDFIAGIRKQETERDRFPCGTSLSRLLRLSNVAWDVNSGIASRSEKNWAHPGDPEAMEECGDAKYEKDGTTVLLTDSFSAVLAMTRQNNTRAVYAKGRSSQEPAFAHCS